MFRKAMLCCIACAWIVPAAARAEGDDAMWRAMQVYPRESRALVRGMGTQGLGRDFAKWWSGVEKSVGATNTPLIVAQYNTLRSVLVQFQSRHGSELTPRQQQALDRALSTFSAKSSRASYAWTSRIPRGIDVPQFPGDSQPWAKTTKLTHLGTDLRLAGRRFESQGSVRVLAGDLRSAVRQYFFKP